MSKKIPQEFIDEILIKTSLKEEISKRITLNKAGHEYHGLCPFHAEKTPSFTVSPRKNFFYCFGCSASGNVISFIMQFEQRDFYSTIELLAGQLGLIIPAQDNALYKQNHESKLLLKEIQQSYQKQLSSDPIALEYLANRGISLATTELFAIGLAPKQNINWAQKLNKSHSVHELLKHAGMIYVNDHQQTSSRFKGRITFPIRNINGDTIGFGARKLNNDANGPKYLNSPETEIFKKSFELYGLYEAKKQNKTIESLIVVEGYMDVVSLHQHGISNAVATLGTAINQNHISTLTKHSKKIYFCFDSDAAGKKAAWKALTQALPLMHKELSVYFTFLPEQEDPDSFIRDNGKEAFNKQLSSSTNAADFLFNKIAKAHDLTTITGRSHAAIKAFELIETIPNSIFKQLIQQDLENKLSINTTIEKEEKTTTARKEHDYNDNLTTVISMLLQEPSIAHDISIPYFLATLDNNKMKWIKKIIATAKTHKEPNTAMLLQKWESHPAYQWLIDASIEKHLLSNSTFKQNIKDRLQLTNNQLIQAKINDIIQESKSRLLNKEEKQALNKLIQIKNQSILN
jgi:DNA primase